MANALYIMKNNPLAFLQTILSPLSMFLLIFFISKGALIGTAIVGGLIVTMFQCGANLQHDMDHMKSDFKTQEMIVSSPTTSGIYTTGMAVSELIYSIPTIIVFSILFALNVTVTPLAVLQIVIVLFLVFAMSVSIHFALGTLASDVNQSWTYNQLIAVLFSTLAPVYYPVTVIPEPYRIMAYLSPTTYAAQIGQVITGQMTVTSDQILIDWTILISLSIFLTWFCISKARWREV